MTTERNEKATPMSLPKNYRPDEREAAIYQRWEKSGYFNPDNLPLPEEAPSYTIILPPPNITDKLHLGHAAMLAIEDVLIRFARMRLRRALWLPGTDHAAIATQNAVEKKLWREKKLTRHDLGREKFLQEVWRFLRSTQSTIQRQMRVMGASLDWSREAFTLDPPRQKAVTEMFVRMYRDGVIYRGQRVVNWCPRCKSTLADDEIEYRPQKGHLYTFRYWKDFPFAISSTRPETKLGDTAVAVNPADERYRPFIGQTFEGDFCGVKLKIKVIADRHVDSSFGTGALGVTPAHSLADEQIARRHDLPSVQVIDQEARIRPGFGRFSSLSVLEARENIAERLREEGLLEKEEEIENNLSVCYRCDTAIEPLPSEQWFVAVDRKLSRLGGKSPKERALECADAGEIEFIPARFAKRYRDWMENLHDWCISRQIWFGHRIPVWYCDCGEVVVDTEEPETCPRCGGDKLTRDPDVLDTWFSSGMWTFSTLGWPDNFRHGRKTGDLARFHPTEVLETGYEIITLWVSRMIMMSLFALGEIPFRKVHLHGMILDQNGKKMSKSKGNGIDPIEVVEKFGTDAVRLSLLIGNTPGNDMRLSEEKIKSYRNFVTKLWNIARYCDFAVKDRKLFSAVDRVPAAAGDADRWILSRLRAVARDVSRNIERHNLSTAGEKLRDFTWGDFADWYLETHKAERNDAVLVFVLRQLLLLWHPFTPFVTEEINSRLFAAEADDNRQLLMIAPWPDLGSPNAADEENFSLLRELIVKIR
ncbi:MAG TPA: valine--tRNA ligase, partial [Candidatus Moranbacteria bacterium]|nr:valine--tRNA ligase [Candidatus Moranbacteria bacterium]